MYKQATKNNSYHTTDFLNGLLCFSHYGNAIKFFIFTYLMMSVRASLPTNPAAYFTLDGDATDASGKGNSGSATSTVTWVADTFGRASSAAYFSGNTSVITGIANNLPTSSITASLWFKPDMLTSPSDAGMMPFSYGGGTCGQSFIISMNNPSISGAQTVYDTQGHCFVNDLSYSGAPSPVGEWQHIVVTSDTQGTSLYLNGVLKNSNANYITNTNVLNKLFVIGAEVSPDGSSVHSDVNGGYCYGAIDNIAIYSYAITSQQVYEIYVNQPPALDNNQFMIDVNSATTITSVMLSATDAADQKDGLIFTVSNVENGYFHLTSDTTGKSTASFTQQQIQAANVVFIPDRNGILPTFQVKVSDGLLWTTPVTANVISETSQPTYQPTYLRSSLPSFSPTLFKTPTSENNTDYAMQFYITIFGGAAATLLRILLETNTHSLFKSNSDSTITRTRILLHSNA